GLNTFIVSRLEIFCITVDAHPHSGWLICLAPIGARLGLKPHKSGVGKRNLQKSSSSHSQT
ncbi:hypothetical protein, partial [Streptococcus cuniculi]|uniref:hypothetical protein n=1 Tax=Streptococcus cuniculi TaxID=1432788 RepID=UPI001ABF04D7